MLWFFQKENARLRYEIRRRPDGNEYELVITHPDGRQVIERYDRSSDVVERAKHLEEALVKAGWRAPDLLLRPRGRHAGRP
jgi:predicted PilT family ATPase